MTVNSNWLKPISKLQKSDCEYQLSGRRIGRAKLFCQSAGEGVQGIEWGGGGWRRRGGINWLEDIISMAAANKRNLSILGQS
jgi:hypothetical protein